MFNRKKKRNTTFSTGNFQASPPHSKEKSSGDDERLIGYLRAISAKSVVQSLKENEKEAGGGLKKMVFFCRYGYDGGTLWGAYRSTMLFVP